MKSAREREPVKPPNCQKCRDDGYVLYWQDINDKPYQYIAYCTCEKGADWMYDGTKVEKGKSKYFIPCVDEVLI